MVCYVPTTSTTFQPCFSFFLLWPLTVLMKQTRQTVHTIKQSILLRCLCTITNNGNLKKKEKFATKLQLDSCMYAFSQMFYPSQMYHILFSTGKAFGNVGGYIAGTSNLVPILFNFFFIFVTHATYLGLMYLQNFVSLGAPLLGRGWAPGACIIKP